MTRPDGGDLLARTLSDAGVTRAFGVHGGHLDAFLVGCVRHGIALTDTRHEAAAVNAADGYARTTGALGVAFATASSGFSNALAGLTHAFADRTPLLLITSSPPLRDAESNVLQGSIDQVALARPAAKWTHRVTVTEEIPHLVSYAIRVALAGAPGPVVLDLPIDVLFRPVREELVHTGGGARLAAPPAPAPGALAEAAAILRDAERPVVIAGRGAHRPGTPPLLQRFAERTGIPVFTQTTQFGAMPADHPLNGYGATNLGALAAAGGPPPDAVLMLGARFGMFTGGRSGSLVAPDAKVVQVDTDAAEIGHIRGFDVGITADCGETLAALLAAVSADPAAWPDRTEWARTATAVARTEPPFAAEPAEVGGRPHPYHALREVARAVGPGATFVIDGGEAGSWAQAVLPDARPYRMLYANGYLGFLGVGAGMAIGTAVADPGRRVVLVVGDGAAGFHLGEIDTMVRHDLPILTVVVNNAAWGMSIHGQDLVYGKEGQVISELADTDYHRAASGLGARGERAATVAEIAPAVARLLGDDGPACLNLIVSGEVVHPVTPMMVGDTTATDEVVVPYYDNVAK
ncbi:MAG TPA: thiamine pyrophosphate-binding protein [Streptosporangiaceae bacterium]|jgi:acetolactate synthase-1/2/3 large subunit